MKLQLTQQQESRTGMIPSAIFSKQRKRQDTDIPKPWWRAPRPPAEAGK